MTLLQHVLDSGGQAVASLDSAPFGNRFGFSFITCRKVERAQVRMSFAGRNFLQHFLRVSGSFGNLVTLINPLVYFESCRGFPTDLGQRSILSQIGRQNADCVKRLLRRNLVVPEAVQSPAVLDFEVVTAMISAAKAVRRE